MSCSGGGVAVARFWDLDETLGPMVESLQTGDIVDIVGKADAPYERRVGYVDMIGVYFLTTVSEWGHSVRPDRAGAIVATRYSTIQSLRKI